MDSSTVICWTSPFVILEVSGRLCDFRSGSALFAYDRPFYGFPGKNGLTCLVNAQFHSLLEVKKNQDSANRLLKYNTAMRFIR